MYVGGSSDGVYESRMFMFLAAAQQNLANIGSQFNDQPIERNFRRRILAKAARKLAS